MSPIDRSVVERKLEILTAALRLLEPIATLDEAAYATDVYRRKATERLLQEVVESAVDINAHMLIESGFPAPVDLYSSFLALGVAGIIAPGLASDLAPAAGLRNRLVHEYDRLNDGIVLMAVRRALELFPKYVAAVIAAAARG